MAFRTSLGLLLGLFSLGACQQDAPQQAAAPARPPVAPPLPQPPPAAPAPRATRTCNIRDDAAANEPFGTDLTPADLVRIGGRVVLREPIENNHLPEQIDTLITVEHAANRFVFYRSPERDLLTQAYITAFDAPYAQELERRLKTARKRQSGTCDSLFIQDNMRMNTVVASLRDGQLRQVFVEPYFD